MESGHGKQAFSVVEPMCVEGHSSLPSGCSQRLTASPGQCSPGENKAPEKVEVLPGEVWAVLAPDRPRGPGTVSSTHVYSADGYCRQSTVCSWEH